MRKTDVNAQLASRAFEFFYWFSRLEFALKENGYLKSHQLGAPAEPGWDAFVARWHGAYVPSAEAKSLLQASPERQVVGHNNTLTWQAVHLNDCKSELAKVVRLVKVVRNNLFHGGKHGVKGWDDPKRTQDLLSAGQSVLDQLASLASLQADYTRYY